MTDYDSDITHLIKDNKIHRFALELQYETDKDRKKQLHEIISTLQGNTINKNDDKGKKQLEKIYSKLDDEEYKFKWQKLNNEQKKNRIRQYLETLDMDEENYNKIENNLCLKIDKNNLKNKLVNYDFNEGKILSIKNLKYSEKKEKYIIIVV